MAARALQSQEERELSQEECELSAELFWLTSRENGQGLGEEDKADLERCINWSSTTDKMNLF